MRNTDVETWQDVATRTLAGARRIIDPVWGGMFQYSDKADWSSPHFEKLLNVQRDAMRAYVLAWQIRHDAADLESREGYRPLADGLHARRRAAPSTPARTPT